MAGLTALLLLLIGGRVGAKQVLALKEGFVSAVQYTRICNSRLRARSLRLRMCGFRQLAGVVSDNCCYLLAVFALLRIFTDDTLCPSGRDADSPAASDLDNDKKQIYRMEASPSHTYYCL